MAILEITALHLKCRVSQNMLFQDATQLPTDAEAEDCDAETGSQPNGHRPPFLVMMGISDPNADAVRILKFQVESQEVDCKSRVLVLDCHVSEMEYRADTRQMAAVDDLPLLDPR